MFGPATDEIRDQGYLGMGTVLYLSFVRYFTVIFLLLGLAVLPNTLYFARGNRYDHMFSIAGMAVRSSMANTGTFSWTPGCPDNCSGRGFCARTCSEWAEDAGRQMCGRPNAPAQGARSPVCVRFASVCSCMPGFGGEACERPLSNGSSAHLHGVGTGAGATAEIPGWCTPPYDVSALAAGEVDSSRRWAGVCSGRGFCAVRFRRVQSEGGGGEATLADRIRGTVAEEPLFSFCQCDGGYYGARCENRDGNASLSWQPPEHGEDGAPPAARSIPYSHSVVSLASGAVTGCEVGACPTQYLRIPGVPPTDTRCGQHGVCIPSDIDPASGAVTGPMSAYRPFTPGVCYCEPGYSGEQCAGGQGAIASVTAWNSIATAVLLVGVLFVYRRRKASEAEFDDKHITPGDFSVFVDNLPDLRLDSKLETTHDTKALYEHFEKIGPVHFIAPATKDHDLLRLQHTRRVVTDRIRMHCEMEEYARRAEASTTQGLESTASKPDAASVGDGQSCAPAASPPTPVTSTSFQTDSKLAAGSGTQSDAPHNIHRLSSDSSSDQSTDGVVQCYTDAASCFHACMSCRCPTVEASAVELNPTAIEIDYRSWKDAVQKGAPRFGQYESCMTLAVHLPVVAVVCCQKQTLVQYLSFIDWRIQQRKRNLSTFEYSRAFVTFTYADLKWVAVKAFKQSAARAKREAKLGKTQTQNAGQDAKAGSASQRGESVEISNPLQAVQESEKLASSPTANITASDDGRRQSIAAGSDPEHIDLSFRGRHLVVQAAPEPEEVLWKSLDTEMSQQLVACVGSSLFACLLATALFFAALAITVQGRDGIIGLVVATSVLGLNYFAAYVFRAVSNYEGHYSTGSKSRSLFMKVFLTQVAITVAASLLAAFGPPADATNGYRQDWFRQAGAFALRIALAEAVVPPVLNLIQAQHRAMMLLGCLVGRSRTLLREQRQPPEYILAEKCASLMRTVLVAAAFGPAMPSLYLVVAAGLLIRYYVDRYCVEHVFAMQKSGAQLIRVLELSMMASLVVNAGMAKVLASAGEGRSASADAVALVFLVLVLWVALAYASWKTAKAKDCWCGTGFLCPGMRYPLQAAGAPGRAAVSLCEKVHQRFVEAMLGNDWFVLYADSPSADFDETGGRPYHELYAEHGLRRAPYLLQERISLFRDVLLVHEEDEVVPEAETGRQYKERLRHLRETREEGAAAAAAARGRDGSAGAQGVRGSTESPDTQGGARRRKGGACIGSERETEGIGGKVPQGGRRAVRWGHTQQNGGPLGQKSEVESAGPRETSADAPSPDVGIQLMKTHVRGVGAPPAAPFGDDVSSESKEGELGGLGGRQLEGAGTPFGGKKIALASADRAGWRKEVEAMKHRLKKLGIAS